jgi:hypothetical protein
MDSKSKIRKFNNNAGLNFDNRHNGEFLKKAKSEKNIFFKDFFLGQWNILACNCGTMR